VKLTDLREDLRKRFDFDPDKANQVYAVDTDRKTRDFQASQNQSRPVVADPVPQVADSSVYSSSAGRVYVRGYTRKDGTYVSAHTRSYPRSR